MKNQLRQDKPDAIIVTLSKSFFKEYPGGRDGVHKVLGRGMNIDQNMIWHQSCGNVPTIEVGWCYIVWDNIVQYRLNIVSYYRNTALKFTDGGVERSIGKRNWVLLAGPTEKAPHEIAFKGCQGFRYTKLLW